MWFLLNVKAKYLIAIFNCDLSFIKKKKKEGNLRNNIQDAWLY